MKSLKLCLIPYFVAASPAWAFDLYSLKSSHDNFSLKKQVDGFYYLGKTRVKQDQVEALKSLIDERVEEVVASHKIIYNSESIMNSYWYFLDNVIA